MSSETWEKVFKEERAKGIDCEVRELRAQARDQVPKQRSVSWVMATLGEERDRELRPRLQEYDVSINQTIGGK